MHFSGLLATLVALGAFAIPAAADGQTFLDDQSAAEGSTNATIDATARRRHRPSPRPQRLPFHHRPPTLLPAARGPARRLQRGPNPRRQTAAPTPSTYTPLRQQRHLAQGPSPKAPTSRPARCSSSTRTAGPICILGLVTISARSISDAKDVGRKSGGVAFTLTASDARWFS